METCPMKREPGFNRKKSRSKIFKPKNFWLKKFHAQKIPGAKKTGQKNLHLQKFPA
jgi:hypothetical protein